MTMRTAPRSFPRCLYASALSSGGRSALKREGKLLSPDLLAHVSPLGWEHINLTGEYRWPKA